MKPRTELSWFVKLLDELILDKVKCPVAKVNEIMRLKKWEINFTVISCSVNNSPFIVKAESNSVIVYGESYMNAHDAKVKAATKFLNQLHYSYSQYSTCTQNVESIQNDQKSTNTIFNDNNMCTKTTIIDNGLSSCSIIEDHEETIFDNRNINRTLSTSDTNHLYSSVIKTSGGKYSNINVINLLQEKCVANHWVFPEYKLTQVEYNSCGVPEFTMECNLLNFKSIGKGSTKQEAKRLAATLIYNQISGCSNEESNDTICEKNECTTSFEYLVSDSEFINLTKECISPETLTQLDFFLKHHEQIDEPCSDNLNELNSSNTYTKGPSEILEEIAKEAGLTVKYVVIASSVKCEMLVQLSTNPITVLIGNGNTLFDAKKAATLTALLYLRTKYATNLGIQTMFA